MKTYKYSHLKLCKPPAPEPPPPPPPAPKAKAKARVKKEKPHEEKPVTLKPEFDGHVSFSHVKETAPPPPTHVEVYRQAREQRQQVRVQRVKSLIAQAI